MLLAMGHLLRLATIFLRCFPAFFRSRNEQALIELALSQQLATVSRYLSKRNPDYDPRHRWKTFLRNHEDGIAAMDFIVVPTVRFRLLYGWFVIGHGRRDIIHIGVTAHPTSPCVVQQFREAFPDELAPRFLIYDNDSITTPSPRIRRLLQHRSSPHSPSRLASRSAEGESAIIGRQGRRVSPGRRSSPSLRVARSSVIAAANCAIWRIEGRRTNFENRQAREKRMKENRATECGVYVGETESRALLLQRPRSRMS
jgi:hypothetical protein